MPGGREPGHVQADLGDDHLRGVPGDAGDLIEAVDRGQHGRVRAGARVRAGGAVGADAAGGGHRGDQRLDPAVERADVGGQGIDLVQQHPGQLGVMLIEAAGQRLDQRGSLGLHLADGQAGQDPRAALPGDQRLDHGPDRQGVDRAGHCRHLNQRVFQQLLQPGPAPGPLLGQVGAQPGAVPQLADLRRRHEAGPQHPPLGALSLPDTVELVRLGPAGQVPGLAGVNQLHVQAGRLQQVEPDTPVIAG